MILIKRRLLLHRYETTTLLLLARLIIKGHACTCTKLNIYKVIRIFILLGTMRNPCELNIVEKCEIHVSFLDQTDLYLDLVPFVFHSCL